MKKLRGLPPPLVEAYEWQDRAECRHLSVAVFFEPDSSRGRVREEHEEMAKRICQRCPGLAACREHAIAAEDHGVWGGLSAHEREVVRASRGRAIRVAS